MLAVLGIYGHYAMSVLRVYMNTYGPVVNNLKSLWTHKYLFGVDKVK
jgi:hypothetical protein